MPRGNKDLAEVLLSDAMCAYGFDDLPAASIHWVTFGSQKVVLVEFLFAASKRQGRIRGSLFRFFTSGYVTTANWDGDDEHEIQQRESGYYFSPEIPSANQDWDGELEHFIGEVRKFVSTAIRPANIELKDCICV